MRKFNLAHTVSVIVFTLSLSLSVSVKAQYHQFERDLHHEHAHELLGQKSFGKLQVADLSSDDMHYELNLLIQESMHSKYKSLGSEVFRSIVKASKIFQLDPFFLSAVIAGESGFNPNSIGTSGEVGLMQILPATAEWMANKFKFSYGGKESLKFPMVNIIIGSAYLQYLRKKYLSTPNHYLAAYNMGPGNLRRALGKNIQPKDYQRHVMKRYLKIYKGIHKKKKWFDFYISRG